MQYEQLELPFLEPDFDDPEVAQNMYLDDSREDDDYWRGRAETAEEELEATNEKIAEAHSILTALQTGNPYESPDTWVKTVERVREFLAGERSAL